MSLTAPPPQKAGGGEEISRQLGTCTAPVPCVFPTELRPDSTSLKDRGKKIPSGSTGRGARARTSNRSICQVVFLALLWPQPQIQICWMCINCALLLFHFSKKCDTCSSCHAPWPWLPHIKSVHWELVFWWEMVAPWELSRVLEALTRLGFRSTQPPQRWVRSSHNTLDTRVLLSGCAECHWIRKLISLISLTESHKANRCPVWEAGTPSTVWTSMAVGLKQVAAGFLSLISDRRS